MTAPYRKKMIEVAIPLDAINKESAREKNIRKGHPSTLHLWWARRPLATCRAVLFTSLIDDPGEEAVPQALLDKIDALASPLDLLPEDDVTEARRKKLFAFIGELVKWENTANETVMGAARELILAATDGHPPAVLDPFCGGGSIPLEAQRLGLQAYASDLNPVAVLVTKALVEIPPKFAGRPPVNPDDRAKLGGGGAWKGSAGLAADVRYYGKWMRDRAFEQISHLYPKGPDGETVVAWLWARTVSCPNPVCGGRVPLARSFWLSPMKGKETWIESVVDADAKTVRFEVRRSGPRNDEVIAAGTKSGRADFTCPMCGQVTNGTHIKAEGMAGRIDSQLMAVVAEGNRSRSYLSPEHVNVPALSDDEMRRVKEAREGFLAGATPRRLTGGTCYGYGLTTWGSLFTTRQLMALITFADLVADARTLVREHATAAGTSAVGINVGGADAYADAVATYLACVVSKLADKGSTICTWDIGPISNRTASGRSARAATVRVTFARQALPMTWDFAETNPFSESVGSVETVLDHVSAAIEALPSNNLPGSVRQLDAAASIDGTPQCAVATDPPYYDNIGYADLSDFFYVWLRRSLGPVYPDIFSTLLTPKDQELVATPYRFNGSRDDADKHFESGMAKAWALVRERTGRDVPFTVYYAFRQLETDQRGSSGTASTGWEKMLTGLIRGSFEITGTWPMRTEMSNRNIASGTNALASSVVLVCRPRADNAPIATLRDFQAALKAELPEALHHMIGGHIAPVDLAQAAIGPGMGVFSRYSRVIEPNGDDMAVRRALELINVGIEEFFNEQEGAFDAYTQFCARWFEQHRNLDGPYGQALDLARAKNISVEELDRDGVLKSGAGKVRLWPVTHYVDHVDAYNPATDPHVTAWEACHYLIAALRKGGVTQAGRLAHRLGGVALQGVELSYRLYAICERNKWSEEALGYNALADSWPDIQAAMGGPEQGQMV